MCAAEEVGFVEYSGLPGKVKTGCMETPEQRSKFCSLHKPREMKAESTDSPAKHMVVESILNKKETRSTTFYEVRT